MSQKYNWDAISSRPYLGGHLQECLSQPQLSSLFEHWEVMSTNLVVGDGPSLLDKGLDAPSAMVSFSI